MNNDRNKWGMKVAGMLLLAGIMLSALMIQVRQDAYCPMGISAAAGSTSWWTYVSSEAGLPVGGGIRFISYLQFATGDEKVIIKDGTNGTYSGALGKASAGWGNVAEVGSGALVMGTPYRIYISSTLEGRWATATSEITSNTVERANVFPGPGCDFDKVLIMTSANYVGLPQSPRAYHALGRIVLKWEPPAVGTVRGYRIYRRPSATEGPTEKIYDRRGTTASTKLDLEDTGTGTNFYIICATNEYGFGPNCLEIAVTPDSSGTDPSITSITDNPTSIGSSITISGANFGSTPGTVELNGVMVNSGFTSWATGSIVLNVPSGVTTGNVYVVDSTGRISNGYSLTIAPPAAPAITTISPKYGFTTWVTTIEINGSGFSGATFVSLESGSPVSSLLFTVVSGIKIVATLESGIVPDVYNIRVTTPVGKSDVSGSTQFTVVGAPTVSSIAPPSASNTALRVITINGNNLLGATSVTAEIGSLAFVVNSNSSITAEIPAWVSPALYNIRVTNPVGSSSISGTSDDYNVTAQPTVESVWPTYGYNNATTILNISGECFVGVSEVQLETYTLTNFTVMSSTEITAEVLAGRPAGLKHVRVKTGTGGYALWSEFSTLNEFTVIGAPIVTSISPFYGLNDIGRTVVITGDSFLGTTQVTLDGASPLAYLHVISNTLMTAEVQAGKTPATYNIRVTNPAGTSAIVPADQYAVVGVPVVYSVTPKTGSSGVRTIITVTGESFYGATSVTMEIAGSIIKTVMSNTVITAEVPSSLVTAGDYNIRVTNPRGTSAISPADVYTIVSIPTVMSVTPNYGYASVPTQIIITGEGFIIGNVVVSLDAVNITSFVVTSTTSITATVPGQSAGPRNIRVSSALGTSTDTPADNFTIYGGPTITTVAPRYGFTNSTTDIIINGTNFVGVTHVSIDAVPVDSYVVTSTTSITAVVPTGQTAALHHMSVRTGGGQSTANANDDFTIVGAPSVTSVLPASGPSSAKTIVTITGLNFLGSTSVTMESVGSITYTVMSNTSITAEVPSGQSLGVYNIRVTNPVGTSPIVSGDEFTVISVPTVMSVTPNYGYASIPTQIIITGEGFVGSIVVSLDAVNITSFVVTSSTSITATVPGQSAGPRNIRVSSPAGTSPVTDADDFTIYGGPTITTVAPRYGFTNSTTDIIINGTNFVGVTHVSIDAVPVDSYVVTSTTSITAVVPTGQTAVLHHMSVRTGGGQSTANANDDFTIVGAPTVTSIVPPNGSNTSSTLITINGTNLLGTSNVVIEWGALTNFTVRSNTVITAEVPAGVPLGVYNVVVTNPVGTSTINSGDQYTVVAVPNVMSVTPNFGFNNILTLISITGENFTGWTRVTIEGTTLEVTFSDDNTIMANVPMGLPAGVKNVRVTSPAGTSAITAADVFTVVGQPVVRSVTPFYAFMNADKDVVITGESLLGVEIGGITMDATTSISIYTVTGNTSITATVPIASLGLSPAVYDIRATNPVGTSANTPADNFTVVGTPSVTSIAPNTGHDNAATNVVINGNNFWGCTGYTIESVSLENVVVTSNTSMTARVPSNTIPAGTYEVFVTNPVGTSPSNLPANRFTVIESIGDIEGPTIESVSIDGKRVIGGEIVNQTFVLTAIITDEPELGGAAGIKPSGTIEVYIDEYSGNPLKLIPAWPQGVSNRMFLVVNIPEEALNLASHLIRIHTRDNIGNVTDWIGTVVLMRGKVQVIGPIANYPNPFKPLSTNPDQSNTIIQYTLSTDAPITVIVYDIAGHEVHRRVYSSGVEGGHAGINQISWNGKSLFGEVVGNGMYVYLIVSGNKVIGSGKLVVQD